MKIDNINVICMLWSGGYSRVEWYGLTYVHTCNLHILEQTLTLKNKN